MRCSAGPAPRMLRTRHPPVRPPNPAPAPSARPSGRHATEPAAVPPWPRRIAAPSRPTTAPGVTPHDVFGRVGGGSPGPGQTYQGPQSRADLVPQPERLVVRNGPLMAAAAVIVGPRYSHRPVRREHPAWRVGMELGGVVTVRAGHAAPGAPLLFRLAGPACRTSLAMSSPASRNSMSMARTPRLQEHRRPVRPSAGRPAPVEVSVGQDGLDLFLAGGIGAGVAGTGTLEIPGGESGNGFAQISLR